MNLVNVLAGIHHPHQTATPAPAMMVVQAATEWTGLFIQTQSLIQQMCFAVSV